MQPGVFLSNASGQESNFCGRKEQALRHSKSPVLSQVTVSSFRISSCKMINMPYLICEAQIWALHKNFLTQEFLLWDMKKRSDQETASYRTTEGICSVQGKSWLHGKDGMCGDFTEKMR